MTQAEHGDGQPPDPQDPPPAPEGNPDPDREAVDPQQPVDTPAEPADTEPADTEPADTEPADTERRVRAVRSWLRLRLRIALVAVLPSVLLLPVLFSRTPAVPEVQPIVIPPVATWTPPPATAGPSTQWQVSPGRATELSTAARSALENGDLAQAQLLALAALEDAVTPETLITAGKALTPRRPTARALHAGSQATLAVTFSPDGGLLATGQQDGTVLLWDSRGGPSTRALAADRGGVRGLTFSPDGATLAVADGTSRVRLWQVRARHSAGILSEPSGTPVDRVVFSRDGTHLATSGASGVRIWTAADRRPGAGFAVPGPRWPDELAPSVPWTPPLAFSPDGRTLVVGTGDGSVALHDPATGRRRGLLTTENYTGQDDPVTALAVARNGRRVASGHASGAVDVWDPARWTGVAQLQYDPELGYHDPVGELSFSADARRLAISEVTLDGEQPKNGQVALVDLPLADLEELPTPLTGPAYGVALSPDGRRLATADGDGVARLWQLDAGSALGSPVRDWPAALCRRAGTNLDSSIWAQSFGSAPYRRLCPEFPSAPGADASAPTRPFPQLG